MSLKRWKMFFEQEIRGRVLVGISAADKDGHIFLSNNSERGEVSALGRPEPFEAVIIMSLSDLDL